MVGHECVRVRLELILIHNLGPNDSNKAAVLAESHRRLCNYDGDRPQGLLMAWKGFSASFGRSPVDVVGKGNQDIKVGAAQICRLSTVTLKQTLVEWHK